MKHVLTIIALLLVLVACAPVQPPAPAAPVPAAQPAQPVVQPAAPAEIPPAPIAVPAEPTPVISRELEDLLKRADQRLKSYQYLELIIPTKKQPDMIYVKGTKIKIKLYEYDPYIPENYLDHIYLDTATKSIVGRCENRKRCTWPQGDNTKKDYTDLNYANYKPKTPYEWLKEIPPTARILGPEVHENRETTKLEYDRGGVKTQMWVDNSYGVPLEIQLTPSAGQKVTYKFNDMQFNTIADRDVTPVSLT